MYNNNTFQKIYKKIDSIAKTGIDGYDDYVSYINELLTNGQLYILRDVLDRKYGIVSSQQMTFLNIVNTTYDTIRFKTTSILQENLQQFYNNLSIYQMGNDIYLQNTSTKVGSINAILGTTSSNLNITNTIDTLIVQRVSDGSSMTIGNTNSTDYIDALLYTYEIAFDFLFGMTPSNLLITTSTTTTTTTADISPSTYHFPF